MKLINPGLMPLMHLKVQDHWMKYQFSDAFSRDDALVCRYPLSANHKLTTCFCVP